AVPRGAPIARSSGAGGPSAAGLAEVLDLLRLEAGAGPLGSRQPTGRGLGDLELVVEVVRGRVGLLGLRGRQVVGLVDHASAVAVLPVDERDRRTGFTGAAGPADAVDVGLLVVGARV